jgi:uncharacterized SAM-binding protein YcdF (DUF218 family)
MIRWLKILVFIAILLAAAGLPLYFYRFRLLSGLAGLLIVNDPLQPADIIFVLNGDVNNRPFFAAELFQKGLAPRIVIPQEEDGPAASIGLYPNGTDVSVQVMQKLGVPAEAITVIPVAGGVTSTRDEAVVLRRYMAENSLNRVIVVTSAFHTRRARWIVAKELAGSWAALQMAAAPEWQFDETNWWQEERGLISLANEYIKLGYYFVMY